MKVHTKNPSTIPPGITQENPPKNRRGFGKRTNILYRMGISKKALKKFGDQLPYGFKRKAALNAGFDAKLGYKFFAGETPQTDDYMKIYEEAKKLLFDYMERSKAKEMDMIETAQRFQAWKKKAEV